MKLQGLPLRTPSLVLRHFRAGDAPAIMALNAEPSTRRWLPSHVYGDLDEATGAVAFLVSQYAAPGDPRRGPYVLAVEESAGGRILGHVGFSALGDEVEVSYAIAEAARGRGYGTEALLHACRWAAAAFGLPRILAITACANAGSIRTLDGAGFARAGEETMRFQGTEQRVSRHVWHADGAVTRPS